MRITAIALAMICFASAGWAQNPTKLFDFANKPSQQGLQEIATVLRTVGDIQQLSIDSAAANLTVSGTPDQLAMASWVVRQLDQPITVPLAVTSSQQQYLMAGKSDNVVRVFHLKTADPGTRRSFRKCSRF